MSRKVLLDLLIVLAIVAVVAIPLVFVDGEFAGSDGQATDAISTGHPEYRPWFTSVFEPPSEEVASGLFAAQAAAGAAVVGYYFGRLRGRLSRAASARPGTGGDAPGTGGSEREPG